MTHDGTTPTRAELLAWLALEQRKAERWSRGNGGVYLFSLSGPELMRLRNALGDRIGEWQCRFVADDKRCCLLPTDHDGAHQFTILGPMPTGGAR